jgi:hypothetical protein
MIAHLPTSAMLTNLLDDVPTDHVTLAELMGRLRERSFGIVMLLLGLVSLPPGVSAAGGVLLAVLAVQMILARAGPVFPGFIAVRRVRTQQVARLVQRAVPVLRYLEKLVRPRWHTPFEATKRVVGFVVLLLGATLLVPVPLSNVMPSLAVMLIAFAYLEEDGVLLCIALAASLVLLLTTAVAVWGMVRATLHLTT